MKQIEGRPAGILFPVRGLIVFACALGLVFSNVALIGPSRFAANAAGNSKDCPGVREPLDKRWTRIYGLSNDPADPHGWPNPDPPVAEAVLFTNLNGQRALWAPDPSDPNRLFLTNGFVVMRTDDGGCTWKKVYSVPGVPEPEDPLMSHGLNNVTLMSSGHRVTSIRIGAGADAPVYLVVDDGSMDPGTFRLLRGSKSGTEWTRIDQNLQVCPLSVVNYHPDTGSVDKSLTVQSLGFAPERPETLYIWVKLTGACGSGWRLYATHDAGGSWSDQGDPGSSPYQNYGDDEWGGGPNWYQPLSLGGVVVNPRDPRSLWTAKGRFSNNGGKSWTGTPRALADEADVDGQRETRIVEVDVSWGSSPASTSVLAAQFSKVWNTEFNGWAEEGDQRWLISRDGGRRFDLLPRPELFGYTGTLSDVQFGSNRNEIFATAYFKDLDTNDNDHRANRIVRFDPRPKKWVVVNPADSAMEQSLYSYPCGGSSPGVDGRGASLTYVPSTSRLYCPVQMILGQGFYLLEGRM